MKKYYVILILLWLYFLVVSYYGLQAYSPTIMRPEDKWKWVLMLISFMAVPAIAYSVISIATNFEAYNKDLSEFHRLNYSQLKFYLFGMLLLIMLAGLLVMGFSAFMGILANSILLIKAFSRFC